MCSKKVAKSNWSEQCTSLHPKTSLIHEINNRLNSLQALLSEVIVSCSEQTKGYETVYALDFDVLYAYLFPTIQRRKSSSFLPSFAAYIVNNLADYLLLPPGTVSELLSFCVRKYPVISNLSHIFSTSEPRNFSEMTLVEVFDLYNKLDAEEQYTLAEAERAVPAIAKGLSAYIAGFRRLNELLERKVISSFVDMFPNYKSYYDDGIVDILHGCIAASRPDYELEKTNTMKNARDAENLATVLTSHARLLEEYRHNRLGSERINVVRLMTNTWSLLKVNLDPQWSRDFIAEELVCVLPQHIKDREPWITVSPLQVATICAFREAYETQEECLEVAKRDYADFAGIQAKIYQVDYEFEVKKREALKRGKGTSEEDMQKLEAEHIGHLKDLGISEWYVRLRRVLSRSGYEYQSLNQSGYFDVDVKYLEGDTLNIYADHIFSKVEFLSRTESKSLQSVFKVFGVQETGTRIGHTRRADVLSFLCSTSQEKIIEIIRWDADKFTTVVWENRLSLEPLIYLLNDILDSLSTLDGEVTATYEDIPKDITSLTKVPNSLRIWDTSCKSKELTKLRQESEVLMNLSETKRLSVQLLVKGINDLLVFPTHLSILTEIGDIHIDLPLSSCRDGPKIHCHFPEEMGVRLLMAPLLRGTHGWRWFPKMIDGFIQQVMVTLRDGGR